MEVVLEMPLLTFLDADIWFAEKELSWRDYTIVKTLPSTRKVDLIDKKEFAATAIDEDFEAFVVHMASIMETMSLYLAKKAQIAALQADKALTEVPAKYSDYVDVFSLNLAIELP